MSQPPQMTLQQAIDLAVQLYQGGRSAEAEGVCRQIIAVQPNHAEALHLLGALSQKAGRSESAVEFICSAIRANPRDAEFHYNLGQILSMISPPRLQEAAAAYRQAIALRPQFASAHYALGVALTKMGSIYAHQTVKAFEGAMRAQPDLWAARLDLGNALMAVGRPDDAIQLLQNTVAAKPDFTNAYFNLGNMFVVAKRYAQAIEPFRRALALQPDFFDARVNLGFALREMDRVDEAIDLLKQAGAERPDSGAPWYHLGLCYARQEHLGKLELAIDAFKKALATLPDAFETQSNLGVALARHGELDRAAEIFEKAVVVDPENAPAKYNLSQIRLLQGDFERGWPLYESRWGVGDLKEAKTDFPEPRWDGLDLAGRRILLYGEQGYGDAIQFIRYAAMVQQRGAGEVIAQVLPPLARLVRSIAGVSRVVTEGDIKPQFDVHCPLLSLPLIFGTHLENIPASVPYVHADQVLSSRWRERMAELPDNKTTNIGLVWAGRSGHSFDRNRSLSREMMIPLAQIPSARFFSLQKYDDPTHAQTPPDGFPIIDWTSEIGDFTDSAALIDNLDLVITVDTAIAHLAGAMGKPVWVLLPFAPDWRWLLNRSDSPWYPTMRLFRQPKAGDWRTSIHEIVQSLQSFRTGV